MNHSDIQQLNEAMRQIWQTRDENGDWVEIDPNNPPEFAWMKKAREQAANREPEPEPEYPNLPDEVFFCFEDDQEERTAYGEDQIQFMTSAFEDDFDRTGVEYYDVPINAKIKELLEPIFGDDLDVGAAECLHTIDAQPEQHQEVINKVREVLSGAGWKEI